jgi:hypothetical protein
MHILKRHQCNRVVNCSSKLAAISGFHGGGNLDYNLLGYDAV